MGDVRFKTIRFDEKRNFELVGLPPLQEKKVPIYKRVLQRAKNSPVANPGFSKYFCRESASASGFPAVAAGNIEYGLCQALHGEESAVAALRAAYGRDGGDIVLGIIGDNMEVGRPANPCGNCRDIMLDDFGKYFEIVRGDPDSGVAVVVPMSVYLFDSFRQVFARERASAEFVRDIDRWLGDFDDDINTAIFEGECLENDAYSPPDLHPERKYYALIRTEENSFVGAHDVCCDYHPIYALRDAARQARRANDPFVHHVLIVCQDFGGGAPHVMYKDRQHLLELNFQGELLSGAEKDPPVYLVTYKDDAVLTSIWKTSVKEWLPFPFTPRNFMDLEKMTSYYNTRGRR